MKAQRLSTSHEKIVQFEVTQCSGAFYPPPQKKPPRSIMDALKNRLASNSYDLNGLILLKLHLNCYFIPHRNNSLLQVYNRSTFNILI